MSDLPVRMEPGETATLIWYAAAGGGRTCQVAGSLSASTGASCAARV